jgi:pimeloyl-ACP methyl ester carboxylesterase
VRSERAISVMRTVGQMLDAGMTLADGRELAYTDCGDPAGPLVFYFHGCPTSRLDLAGFDRDFAARGVRVVSADRPGYGGSSPQPGRGLRDWPADVAALADHLGAGRFAVVGMSSGAPYAVACAALLPGRITGVGVVAGVTDMGWPPAWQGYDEADAELMRIGDEAAAAAWCEQHYGSDGSEFPASVAAMAAPDAALLEDQELAGYLTASLIEAFRQGVAGIAADMTVQGRPWPFDPGAITAPAKVVHGQADPWVPLAHARHTAGVIPGAELAILPGHGHISVITQIPRLCADLVSNGGMSAP